MSAVERVQAQLDNQPSRDWQTVDADDLRELLQRLAEVEGRRELDDMCAKIEADAVAGLRYIERHYGRLEGVGWDRVFNAHDELFALAGSRSALSTEKGEAK